MKVCIIAGRYASSKDGIGRYTRNLIQHIKASSCDINLDIISTDSASSKAVKSSLTENKILPGQFKNLLEPVARELGYYHRFRDNNKLLIQRLENTNADIYHAISPSESAAAVILNKRPLVTTFHDVIPLISESRYLFEKFYFKYYANYAKQSDKIMADSKSTKKDLQDIFNISANKIKIVYPGIDIRKFYPISKKQNRTIKHILYLGGLIKRKGIYETLYAFDRLLKDRTDIKLSIGGQGDEFNNLKNEIKKLHIDTFVTLLQFIDEKNILELYHNSDLFVYPSKYEGFGLTPLEAMASGVPVITSSASSLPEVVANAGITVDPDNINELYLQMKKVIGDNKLQEKMREKGIDQAKKFSLEKCSKETMDIYRSLL